MSKAMCFELLFGISPLVAILGIDFYKFLSDWFYDLKYAGIKREKAKLEITDKIIFSIKSTIMIFFTSFFIYFLIVVFKPNDPVVKLFVSITVFIIVNIFILSILIVEKYK